MHASHLNTETFFYPNIKPPRAAFRNEKLERIILIATLHATASSSQRSLLSAMAAVRPHVRCYVRPIATPGTPTREAPMA